MKYYLHDHVESGAHKSNNLISMKSLYDREIASMAPDIKEKTFSHHYTLGGKYATIAAGGLFFFFLVIRWWTFMAVS